MATLWWLPRWFSTMSLSSTQVVGQARSGGVGFGGLRCINEGPGEDGAGRRLSVVVLAGLFSLVAEYALVDADVVAWLPRWDSTMSLRSTQVVGHWAKTRAWRGAAAREGPRGRLQ